MDPNGRRLKVKGGLKVQSRGVESLKALFNVSIGDFAKENPLLLIQLPLQELRSKYSTKRLLQNSKLSNNGIYVDLDVGNNSSSIVSYKSIDNNAAVTCYEGEKVLADLNSGTSRKIRIKYLAGVEKRLYVALKLSDYSHELSVYSQEYLYKQSLHSTTVFNNMHMPDLFERTATVPLSLESFRGNKFTRCIQVNNEELSPVVESPDNQGPKLSLEEHSLATQFESDSSTLHPWQFLSFAEMEQLCKRLTHVLPQYMACQVSSGDVPLHYAIKAHNTSSSSGSLATVVLSKCLAIRKADNCTLLDLDFEKKFWGLARVLTEHQLIIGAIHSPEFLQGYFFKAVQEQGGVDFLPHLLDLWMLYFPDHDLNFSVDTTGRTPWWYLVNSNDVTVMYRALQTLKSHSVDLTTLLTHTRTGAKLAEEAENKNKDLFLLIHTVTGWHSGEADPDTADQDAVSSLGSNRTLLQTSSSSSVTSSFDQSESNSTNLKHSSATPTEPDFSTPHSWDAYIQQHFSSLNKLIQSLPSKVLTQQDAQNRTICHSVCTLYHHLSDDDDDDDTIEVEHLLELLSCVCLPWCMVCQDSSGNTPLHCAVETQNTSADAVESILGFVPPECLVIRNADNCTPLDLAFEKKLWAPARILAEHQLKTGAANSSQFLQGYFFKAVSEQGGVDFLPHLLDLWKHYCPDLDLNFGLDTTGRTPWWYLFYSNDVSVMCRALQALKKHSIDIMSLLTHTDARTTLVEEAVENNRGLFTMIRMVTEWHHSEAEQKTVDQEISSSLGSSRSSSCSSLLSFDPSESQLEQDVSFNPFVRDSQCSNVSSTYSTDEEGHQLRRKVSKSVNRIERTCSATHQETDATLSASGSLDYSESNTNTLQHSSFTCIRTKSNFFTPHSWDAEIQQHSSVNKLIESLPLEALTQKDAQGRTICHALCSLCHHLSLAGVERLPELLSGQCMACQDSSGNTPLHCAIDVETQNTSTGAIESILALVPPECLLIRNADSCTPLDLAFEKKLWAPARVLAEHQLKTGAANPPKFLQGYFFKSVREQGGIDFLPHLVDLWKHYCPDLDLNFGVDTTGRTPWWYLVNSNDVSVMGRVLQALKKHSIDLTSLLTHTRTGAKLVEEAENKNKNLFLLIHTVAGWQSGEADPDTADQDAVSSLGSNRTFLQTSSSSSSFDQSESNSTNLKHSSATPTEPDFSTPHSWDAYIQQHFSSLNKLIQSLPSKVLTQQDAQNRTICHSVCTLYHHLSNEVEHLPELEHLSNLLSCVCLPQCMACQDSSGNTPLHCAIDTQNTSADAVESILGFVPPECLVIRNADNCTPFDLAFEKKLWAPARVLAEHQLKTGAANSPEFLQGYFFQAMREQGGVDFLPHLLDLWEHYFPDLDLNFSVDSTTGRTPWWYLLNSNDVSVMCTAIQALKTHSVDFTSLLTHTGTETTLVEEAVDYICWSLITGWHNSEADEDTTDQDIASSSCSSRTLSRTSSCSSLSSLTSSDSSDEERHQVHLKPRKFPPQWYHNEVDTTGQDTAISLPSHSSNSDLLSFNHSESNTNTNILLQHSSVICTKSDFFAPHSWDAEINQHSSVNELLKSLPLEALTQKDAQGRTICHALCSLCHRLSSAEAEHLPELLSGGCLPQCMACQDSSGNTPLHCAIEMNASAVIVESILGFVPPECLMIRNADNCTPLDLAFEKKLWAPARVLAEHLIKAGAANSRFLQGYFFQAMSEQGGVDFLPHLLDLWEHYFPDLDLNFSVDTTGHTPWWYLVNSNDVSVMYRALQALKSHSVDVTTLLTHTGTTTTLVEEAENNKDLFLLIRRVTGCHSGEADLATCTAQDVVSSLCSTSSLLQTSSRSSVTLYLDHSESNSTNLKYSSATQTGSDFSTPHSWDAYIQQHISDLPSLNKLIPSKVLTRQDAHNRTICHSVCSLYHRLSHGTGEVEHLPELLSCVCLPQCVACLDSSGNTPLHCAIDTQNTSADAVESILGFVPPECLVIRNADNCTPFDLAFEKKLWAPARVLAEHQLKTGAANSPEFLQGYFFQAMREQGGVDFLPHLLDLWEHYFPDLDLNFSVDSTTGRTPWWYLLNSNDVSVMCTAIQALKTHSVDFTSLLTHTGTETTLVEVAVDKNRGLFCKVAGWHHSEADIASSLCSSRTLLQTSLDLAFEKKLWGLAHVLVEHQIKTGATKSPELLRSYFFKAIPHLLDLCKCYFPGLDLSVNFSIDSTTGRTPWWYLLNSNDVSVMCRIVETLENHSIDFTSLLTHIRSGTTLVEEAVHVDENRVLVICKVPGWHRSKADQDTADQDMNATLSSSRELPYVSSCFSASDPSSFDLNTSIDFLQHCSGTQTERDSFTPHSWNAKTQQCSSGLSSPNKVIPSEQCKVVTQRDLSATELSTPKQVSRFTASLRSLGTDSDEEVTAWQAWIEKATNCLHAGYYSRMLEVLKFGKVPPSLPPEIAMAAQFGCAFKFDKHSEAAKHLESLKMIATSAQSGGNESIASVYQGDIEFTQSRYTEAAKHYSHAYQGGGRLIVPTFSAVSAELGSAFRNASKVVDAVQAYRRAIATADSKKDELSAHTSLGNLFQSVGENASALAEYEHSIRLSEELKDHVSLGWAYGNMGNAYLGLYQRDKDLNYLTKALDLTVKHEPTPQAISRAYNNLGTAHQALNERDRAEENYDLALGQSIYGNDIPGQARVCGNINVLMLRKDYERSIPHYTEVLHLSKDRSTVSTAFHNRGCSYYEWAESKKATLFQKDTSSVKKDQFFLNGPDFKDCEGEHQPPLLPNSILKYYQQGRQDLEEVVKYHEETFDNIKGTSKGLTLSVSLFETNSRTFHRLQDCLVNLGEWEMALVVAEQSRTRTLGELLVKRKGWQIDHPLTAPLSLETISNVVKSQHSIVVYLSYTGARLLGWVLAPKPSNISVNMFEVPLEDDQFEGKSFDYYLRYNLTEVLVERSFEMYRALDYQSELNEPVRKLYRLVGRPLMKIFKELEDPDSTPGVQDIVIVPDSYTNLLPFPCLLADEDEDGGGFLGDSFTFRIMPSLLTMGVVDQLPSVVVQVPADSQNMCVVGNPTIPTFMYNGDKCSLGKLPFATREAEWVANTLKTTPILHEQATKNAVLMRIMNAKVIHMATHGNASAGFLAFAGVSSRNGEAAEAKSILLYPEDIERLNISPALVVLSSCDSARGTVKVDGILGMVRAFILSGAQAVLTTPWRVPDESASVFMQFFYQYLMDGLKASLALQKATLSLRCFSKYSQYINWSGYQLTGREIQFDITNPSTAAALEARLGKSSVFPRLEMVKKLESAFLKDPRTPSDVQILRGSPTLNPSEPLIDFIHSFHHAFKGGIFCINGRSEELIDASAAYIKQVTGTVLTASQTHHLLIIFDCIDQMPLFSDPATSLMALLRNSNTHIVVISKNYAPPDALLKEVDRQLLRGCKIIDVEPLSMIHTTQRIVHSVLKAHHLAPTNEDQNIFEKLAEFTSGSPALTDVATALLLSEVRHDSQDNPQDIHDTLVTFKDQLSLDKMGPSTKPVIVVSRESPEGTAIVRETSKNVYDHIDETDQDLWCTSSTCDSWQAVTMLVDQCSLTAEEKLLLFAVSMFSCSPIPMSMVTEVSSMIAKASQKLHISTSLHSKLFQMHLMKRYPLPVIMHPSLNTQKQSTEQEFVYMPQVIARAIWKDMMSPTDRAIALSTSYMSLHTLADNTSSSDVGWGFLGGLCSLLLEVYELNYELMGKEVNKLYLRFHVGEKQFIGAQARTQEDRGTYYWASLWTPAAPNPQVPYYAVFSVVHQSDLEREFQSVTEELADLEPGTKFLRAPLLISLCTEAVELIIPDENVCKQQYGCRIIPDASPPRFTQQELKSATNIPRKLLKFIPETYVSDQKVPARCPLELPLHGTVDSVSFTVWVPGKSSFPHKVDGKQTSEYKKFQNNFDKLLKVLINHVPPGDLASKLFAANFIGDELKRKSNREIADEAERINKLLAAVHNQIELNKDQFLKFIIILKEYPQLTELIKLLEL